MNLNDVLRKKRRRAFLTACFVGGVLNLLNNTSYFPMFYGAAPFSWSGLAQILATFFVPYAVSLYSQRIFVPIHVALLNIKNAFYILDRDQRVSFVSNKLVEELNHNNGATDGKKYAYGDVIGMKFEDLARKFGFDDAAPGQNQVLGKWVHGRRYGQISAMNPAVELPAQGMFIRKASATPADEASGPMVGD